MNKYIVCELQLNKAATKKKKKKKEKKCSLGPTH